MNRSLELRAAPDHFGPWVPGLSDGERQARWRSLAALAMVFLGPLHPLVRTCVAAEGDPVAADTAWAILEGLPALRKRRLLATYAALSTPKMRRPS